MEQVPTVQIRQRLLFNEAQEVSAPTVVDGARDATLGERPMT